MGGINVGRWILGGLLAGVIINVFEAVGHGALREQWEAAATAHNLPTEGGVALFVLMGFIAGLVAVWFYAAARPRFGAGPMTAVKVAVALWIGSYLLAILAYCAMGLFPTGLLVPWGVISLIEMIVATVAGAWVYKEGAATAA
ncbi:MAG: hypothetical protein ACRD2Z_16210 [Thermoanaerobaculia bacterium]